MPQDVLGVPWPAGPDQYSSIGDTFVATGYSLGVGMVHSGGTNHPCPTFSDLPAGAPAGWVQWVDNPGVLMRTDGNSWTKIAQGPVPWTTYTPRWGGADNVTMTIGQGTIRGRYAISSDKTLRVGIFLQRGTGMSIGSPAGGGYKWDLPTGLNFRDFQMAGGTGIVRPNGGGGSPIPCVIEAINATQVCLTSNSGRIDAGTPGSWQVGDLIKMQISGEVY